MKQILTEIVSNQNIPRNLVSEVQKTYANIKTDMKGDFEPVKRLFKGYLRIYREEGLIEALKYVKDSLQIKENDRFF